MRGPVSWEEEVPLKIYFQCNGKPSNVFKDFHFTEVSLGTNHAQERSTNPDRRWTGQPRAGKDCHLLHSRQ